MKRFFAKLALTLAVAAVPCFPLRALQSSMREQSVSEVVKASDAAVVLIETADSSGGPLSQGSGFIISQDGLIVTNYHVVDGAASVSVTLSNGASFSAQGTVSASKDADFALLKVPGKNLPFVHLAASNSVARGERVIAIGSPLGLQNSVSDGIVSGLRTVGGVPYVQTSAPISHGDSGGPLLNSNGEAIGVLTFGLKGGENLNFALSVEVLKPYIASRTVTPFRPTSSNNAQVSEPTPSGPTQQDPGSARPAQAPGSAPNAAALQAAEQWLVLVDTAKYGESWDAAAPILKNCIPRKDWIAFLKDKRKRMGRVASRKLLKAAPLKNVPGLPPGQFVGMKYQTSFEKLQTGVEVVVPVLDNDGTWRVSEYVVQPAQAP